VTLSVFIGGYSKLGVIYESIIKAIKRKKHRQLLVIEFNSLEEAMKQFHTLRKKVKKIGGITLLDEKFTEEFITNLKLRNAGKFAILVNVLSSSDKSFNKTKEKVNLLVEPAKVIALPEEYYKDHIQEFWMLRVILMFISGRKEEKES
jgi:FAD/FMN-containing dehydrogenase